MSWDHEIRLPGGGEAERATPAGRWEMGGEVGAGDTERRTSGTRWEAGGAEIGGPGERSAGGGGTGRALGGEPECGTGDSLRCETGGAFGLRGFDEIRSGTGDIRGRGRTPMGGFGWFGTRN